jgi:hypothetical protein
LDKHICVRLICAQQLGQSGNAGSNAPCLVLGRAIGGRAPPGLVLKINVTTPQSRLRF